MKDSFDYFFSMKSFLTFLYFFLFACHPGGCLVTHSQQLLQNGRLVDPLPFRNHHHPQLIAPNPTQRVYPHHEQPYHLHWQGFSPKTSVSAYSNNRLQREDYYSWPNQYTCPPRAILTARAGRRSSATQLALRCYLAFGGCLRTGRWVQCRQAYNSRDAENGNNLFPRSHVDLPGWVREGLWCCW